MKVLFLDYDGVLNRFDKNGPAYTPLLSKTIVVNGEPKEIATQSDNELVYRLNLIVDRTGCEIVLSSSWRHDPLWRETMAASGIFKDLLDRTATKTKSMGGIVDGIRNRGVVIQAWLDEHPEVTKYAILDDDADAGAGHGGNFFKTECATGLTQEVADAVEAHLGKE